ncbi:hypothetical protein EDD11_000280 [Mortierella claussenii]|nr:hypothetical protein EDD11_000280 [Mortierella claussenii]
MAPKQVTPVKSKGKPPKERTTTTTTNQKQHAGIIRSFKVQYSRRMIRVISDHRANRTRAGSSDVSVPNNQFWPCFAKAWDDVTQTTIRNCFAHVPTIPAAMQAVLRVPTEEIKDTRDEEMENLKQELKALYPSRADAIEQQKDYGVLAFLKCCEGKGPTQQIMNAIKTISKDEKFQTFFLPDEEMKVVYEDQEESDGDSDADYHPEDDAVHPAVDMQQRTMQRRSGLHEMYLPLSIQSSPDSNGSPERESQEEVVQCIEDVLDGYRDDITHSIRPDSFQDTNAAELFCFYSTAVRVRDDLEILRDLLGLRSPLPQ